MTTSPKVIFRGGIRRRLSNRLTRDLSHLTLFSYLELGNDLAYKSGYLNFSNGTDQEKDLKAKAQAPVRVKKAPFGHLIWLRTLLLETNGWILLIAGYSLLRNLCHIRALEDMFP
jgi:hypothetical protein